MEGKERRRSSSGLSCLVDCAGAGSATGVVGEKEGAEAEEVRKAEGGGEGGEGAGGDVGAGCQQSSSAERGTGDAAVAEDRERVVGTAGGEETPGGESAGGRDAPECDGAWRGALEGESGQGRRAEEGGGEAEGSGGDRADSKGVVGDVESGKSAGAEAEEGIGRADAGVVSTVGRSFPQ